MTLYPNLIKDALKTVRYPGSGKDLIEAGMLADNMRIDGMSVSFSLVFEKSTDPFMRSVVHQFIAFVPHGDDLIRRRFEERAKMVDINA